MGRNHPALVELVKECLNNAPDRRPTTDDLLARLQRMRKEVEGGCGGSAVGFDLSKMKLLQEVKIKDRQIEELTQQQVTYYYTHRHINAISLLLQEMHETELEQNRMEFQRKQEVNYHTCYVV